MRVAVDLTIVDPPGVEATGVGRHAVEATRALVAARPGWRFVVAGRRADVPGAEMVRPAWPTERAGARVAWLHVRAGTLVRRCGADVWFSPAPLVPATVRGPAVATFHDLVFLDRPQLYRGRLHARHAGWAAHHAATRAQVLVCVSGATARAVVERLGADSSRVVVVHNGVSDVFRGGAAGASRGRHLLFVGTFEARKGLNTLAAALPAVRAAGVEAPLVLAGRPGWGAADALARLRREPGVEVRLDPDDPALAALYGDALAVLYPSAQEGFGLPVAEAMAAGRPVIASDLDAIREWAGDVPWYVPPDDPGRLAEAIVALLASPDGAAARAAKGTEVAAGLSWAGAGERIAAVLERAVTGR
jgi:glycosyltransferase involved in cell wall biosynthesis